MDDRRSIQMVINYKFCRENSDEINFEAQFLIKSIPEISRKKILDVGCGTGDMAINMMRRGFDITGVDMSNEDIQMQSLKPINIICVQIDL